MDINDNILVTGSNGFIAQNMISRLKYLGFASINEFTRDNTLDELHVMARREKYVFHLAGENRPTDKSLFQKNNVDLTAHLTDAILSSEEPAKLLFASSIHAEVETEYGISKRLAEDEIKRKFHSGHASAAIFRLPGVFGKWARPNYNSVVATFCENLACGKELSIVDGEKELSLTYVDDVVNEFINSIDAVGGGVTYLEITPKYSISVKELAEWLTRFAKDLPWLDVKEPAQGLDRCLYATFLSYLPSKKISHGLKKHTDERGDFVEVLKHDGFGQISYITVEPGKTRGNHYHHTKNEKFLVVSGIAEFTFINIRTNVSFKKKVEADMPTLVTTVPGWAHNIKNIGEEKVVAILWANEVFDPTKPDTVSFEM